MSDDDKVYGLPMDSGPMALFYNKKVFDKYKIAVPTTWDEYVEAARKLHKADPKVYIANDTGDAGLHHQPDLAGRFGAPTRSTAPRCRSTSPTRVPRSTPTPGRS